MNKLNHIAFIMDGNGRWGKKNKRNRNYGHLKGVETVKKIVRKSLEQNVPIVTFYVFSTENWKRPKNEINFLFRLIKTYFHEEVENIIKQGIKINIIGEINQLSKELKKILKRVIYLTRKNKKIIVNLAINYGSRVEIMNSVKKNKGRLSLKKIEDNLYTRNTPDPDILIRTGGHQRLSNFMLWQLAYTELFFLKKLWPDFNGNDLYKIITDFKKIKRNFGGI